MAGAAIKLESVTKHYMAGLHALDPLNLSIEPGEFVSLLGPSGCGKSTLLRLIAELTPPTSGKLTTTASAHQGEMGYVFQDAHLLPWRTVLDNVKLPLELRGVPKDDQTQKASHAVHELGLDEASELFPNQLSGGMAMRVSLARALVTQPKLLLLDEPFAALDEFTRHRLGENLRELWTQHRMTVIFVTHSVSESAFLANRTLVFSRRPGRILKDHRSQLPERRGSALRTEPTFTQEVRVLYETLQPETAVGG